MFILYKVVDKETHEYEDGEKLELYRGESMFEETDIWCVDLIGINRQTKSHWRYKTKEEALAKYNSYLDT